MHPATGVDGIPVADAAAVVAAIPQVDKGALALDDGHRRRARQRAADHARSRRHWRGGLLRAVARSLPLVATHGRDRQQCAPREREERRHLGGRLRAGVPRQQLRHFGRAMEPARRRCSKGPAARGRPRRRGDVGGQLEAAARQDEHRRAAPRAAGGAGTAQVGGGPARGGLGDAHAGPGAPRRLGVDAAHGAIAEPPHGRHPTQQKTRRGQAGHAPGAAQVPGAARLQRAWYVAVAVRHALR
mmetsp:Transcript_67066/g.190268  ORF Transcript_67066/g.190268 Transcript_67066/m.190268 type:complete len:243 (+) Transcript_67066:1114-1842(+)